MAKINGQVRFPFFSRLVHREVRATLTTLDLKHDDQKVETQAERDGHT